jgi:hypothetical protein
MYLYLFWPYVSVYVFIERSVSIYVSQSSHGASALFGPICLKNKRTGSAYIYPVFSWALFPIYGGPSKFMLVLAADLSLRRLAAAVYFF